MDYLSNNEIQDMKGVEIYKLNPAYKIRSDKKRAILYSSSVDPVRPDNISDFIGFFHPLFAIIFSFFDGETRLKNAVANAAELLNLKEAEVLGLISPLIENPKELNFSYDKETFFFPKNILIKKTDNTLVPKIDVKQFLIPKNDLDFKSWRLYTPLDILFMVNTRCVTECIYCYADCRKTMDLQIKWERLKEIIKEAKAIGVRSFDITGGEFFYYENWELLLRELLANGFLPYITTKIPISKEQIAILKEIGLPRIQISLDSIVKEELVQLLKVTDDYCERIKETLKNLDEAGLKIYINSQLTSINENSIDSLLSYLLGLKNIKKISIGAAGYSLYKSENFVDYKIEKETLKRVEELVDRLKLERPDVSLSFSGAFIKDDFINDTAEKRKTFHERARCSANFYAMIILPNGNVTICEELYFHPRFNIGDLNQQSLMEVWNSPKALGLYNLTKEEFRDESACKTCDTFTGCHKHKGVCWKQILYAYGLENWDYPDPKCPLAPKPVNEFYI